MPWSFGSVSIVYLIHLAIRAAASAALWLESSAGFLHLLALFVTAAYVGSDCNPISWVHLIGAFVLFLRKQGNS